jgi:hypothetical protein
MLRLGNAVLPVLQPQLRANVSLVCKGQIMAQRRMLDPKVFQVSSARGDETTKPGVRGHRAGFGQDPFPSRSHRSCR